MSSCTSSDVTIAIPVVTYNVEDETGILHAARGQLIEKRKNPQWRKFVKNLIIRCVPAVHQKAIEKIFLYGTSKPAKVVCSVLRLLFWRDITENTFMTSKDPKGDLDKIGQSNIIYQKYLSDETEEVIKYILSHCFDDLDHPQVWGTLVRKRYNNLVRGWYSRELERIGEE